MNDRGINKPKSFILFVRLFQYWFLPQDQRMGGGNIINFIQLECKLRKQCLMIEKYFLIVNLCGEIFLWDTAND